jgi:hypothetical protein
VATTALPTVSIGVYDAQGNFVSTYVSVVKVSIPPSPGLLQGTPIRSVSNGAASFNDLSFPAPPSALYQLVFVSPGLVGATVNVTVAVGPSAIIRAVSEVSLTRLYASATTVAIVPPLVVRAFDGSGGFVNTSDAVQRLSKVTLNAAASSPNPPALGGASSLTMVNGEVVFDTLHIDAPLSGTYVFDIFVQQDSSQNPFTKPTMTLSVATGLPYALRSSIADPGVRVYAASTSPLPTITIFTVDAGGNVLSGLDNAVRNITVTSVSTSSTTYTFATPSVSTVVPMATGSVDFTSLAPIALIAPQASA